MDVAIIPIRLDSKRLIKKPLQNIAGKPLFQWVYDAVSAYYPNTYVATEDLALIPVFEMLDIKYIITGKCCNGTERCAMAVKDMAGVKYVINVQGDMPFITQEHFKIIDTLFAPVNTLYAPATQYDKSFVEVDGEYIKEFTRTPTRYKHIGIYKYRYDALMRIAEMPPTNGEFFHSLEQLRWSHYIRTMAAPAPDTLSVDTPEDLEAAKFMALQIANSNAIMNIPEFNPIGLKGKRIITSGMGKAGQIAQLAASLLASNGVTSHFIHPADAQHGDLGRIEKTDTLLLFSNSGETRELIELCELTKNDKYVVTSNPQSTLAQMCQPILTGNPLEVCPLGLTPSTSLSTMLLITQHILFSITEINRIEYGKLHHGGYLGQKSR